MEISENIKNKLLPYQVNHVKNLKYSLTTYNRALDTSDTGTGKTFAAIATCVELGLKPLIICPKSVISAWKKVLETFNATYYGLSNYETIQNCKMFTAASKNSKVTCQWIKRVEVTDKDDKKPQKKIVIKKKNNIDDAKKKTDIEYTYVWSNLPNDIVIIFDEAHRCKNTRTLNNTLLLTLSKTTAKILMLSATIADKPENFVLAGFVLGLYKTVREANNWIASAGEGHANIMQGVHKELVPEYMSRMKIKDLGDLFPENQMLADCMDMECHAEIQEQYELIEKEVERLKNKEESSGCVLAQILYARMRIENLKTPILIELANKYLEEGNSVAIFVNFTATLKLIAEQLKTSCVIYGEQPLDDRDKNIADFNSDKSRVIIANIRSGGVGISLQDQHGNFPRVSIISPSWSAQDIIQALGRVFRANGKTKVRQRIVFCKDTIEEEICKSMKEKIMNISSLNDGDVSTYKIKGLIDEKDAEKLNKSLSEFDVVFQKINTLNAKKNRLDLEMKQTIDELKTLELLLNSFVK